VLLVDHCGILSTKCKADCLSQLPGDGNKTNRDARRPMTLQCSPSVGAAETR